MPKPNGDARLIHVLNTYGSNDAIFSPPSAFAFAAAADAPPSPQVCPTPHFPGPATADGSTPSEAEAAWPAGKVLSASELDRLCESSEGAWPARSRGLGAGGIQGT